MISFLEKFKLYELSYEKTTNLEHKFELAVKLKKLHDAKDLARTLNVGEKWKILADLAIQLGEFTQAEECMFIAKDYNGLLLFYSWYLI